jgi:hypothetical protein
MDGYEIGMWFILCHIYTAKAMLNLPFNLF